MDGEEAASARRARADRGAALSVSPSAGARLALGAWGLVARAAAVLAPGPLLNGSGPGRAERLGEAPPPCGPGRLLLHAVSAGEVSAAAALAGAIARAAPGLGVLLTTGTREGRAAAERVREACRAVEAVSYLPWDRPGAVLKWLARLSPAAVVTVEAELWPGLFLGARSLGIPVAVASGRLRAGEARRYALARPVFRPVVQAVSWVGARTEEDRDRFVAIGAPPSRVEVTGDLKLDAPSPRVALPGGWAEVLAGGPPTLLGASTHAPEEAALLSAAARLRERGEAVRLILAPRKVARAGEVERFACGPGLAVRRLSEPPGPADVLVVDVFGILPALWPFAAVAFLGGTLAPLGGHSPVEAAEAGVPLVAGPSLEGVGEVAGALRSVGALRDVGTGAPAELAQVLSGLLADAADRRRRGEAGRRALAPLRGAAGRSAARILALLPAR